MSYKNCAAMAACALALFLSGCTTVAYRAADVGGDSSGVRALWLEDKAEFESLSPESHYRACSALLELGSYGETKECLALLDRRTDALTGDPLNPFDDAESQTTTRAVYDSVEADYLLSIGKYQEAFDLADKAVDTLVDDSGKFFEWKGTVRAAYVAGIAQMHLGAPRINVKYYQAASSEIMGARDYHLKQQSSYIAEMHFVEENYQAALALLTSEKSQASTGDKALHASMNVISLGLAPAINYYNTGDLNLAGEWVNSGGRVPHLYMISKSQMMLGQAELAKRNYDTLLEQLSTSHFTTLYWKSLDDRGMLAKHDGDDEVAITYLEQAVTVLERQRASISNEGNKISFAGEKQRLYHDIIALLIENNDQVKAFEYSDKAKARALVDMLAQRRSNEVVMSPDTLLLKELNESRQALTVATLNNDNVESKTRALKRKTKEIREKSPQLASLVSAETPAAKVIQQKLSRDETLVQFSQVNDGLYVFVVTQHSINSYPIDVKDLQTLGAYIKQYREQILRKESDVYLHSSRYLFKTLLTPFIDTIKTERLIIVADGSLHYLPFNTLHDGNDFLINYFDISYLPSSSVLSLLKHREHRKKSLLAFGNPDLGDADYDLPGAEKEVRSLKGLYANSAIMVRKQASETQLKALGGTASYLHIASHGEFNSAQPLNSRLLLSPDSKNDGYLTVHELYDMQLPVDMVVLSACETGLGDVSTGNDVVGLTRGFLYAGANTIVASQWVVDDRATEKLMINFYGNTQRMSKSASLRAAQAHIMSTYNSHPYYWGAFQLTGLND